MKKILLLGGSAQQLVVIQAAKDLGYYTIVCDYLPDNPGQYVADKFYGVSVTDVDAIYGIAVNEGVSGVLAYASDPAALPAAIVASRLGLPTNNPGSVEILGLKHLWRKFLQDNGFACPKVLPFHSGMQPAQLKEAIKHKELAFPVVVKPTDSSGSKGVTVLDDMDGLEEAVAWADSYSRNKILLVEEYVWRGYPSIIGGDIFIWDGKIVFYGEMECLRDTLRSPLIPIGKKTLMLSDTQRKCIRSELQRVVAALDIRFGEMNIEIVLDKDNNVHFLELGPRAGGNMIPVQLGDAFGIDMVKANVRAAMGEAPDFIGTEVTAHPGFFMHYVLHSYGNGLFNGVFIDDCLRRFVYREVIYKKEGDEVKVFDGADKALGIVFLRFDTVDEMEYFCENHNSLIKIRLQ